MIEFPHPGISTWKNQHGIAIFRLHYSADPDKTPEWAEAQRKAMTSEADYRQEYEIDFGAKSGTLVYQLHPEATLESSFPIPPAWTRYCALDPHPVVPHAFLWLAVDKWGDAWCYRELWPSRVYGAPGSVPENDNRYSIKQYVETIQWLESAENPENQGQDEDIFTRVIDYAARAMGQGFDNTDPTMNFQKRYEELGGWRFQDSIKDNQAGPEKVNEWLKPRDIEQPDGTFKPKSRLHIFEDKCPELVHELKTNRFQLLTAIMADRADPSGKPVPKRNHLTDCLKYLLMADPVYVKRVPLANNWKPMFAGINY
jgi:hypothetical protein